MTAILSSFFVIQVAHAPVMPIGGASNRIVVEFRDNLDSYSYYLSSKYNLPIVGKDYDGRFAVFQVAPVGINLDSAFRVRILDLLRQESVAQSAHYDYYVCMVWAGGCGGGGGSCSPYFSLSASTPSFFVRGGQTQATSIITVSSICGYSGPVNLAWQSNPCPSQVSNISFSPSVVAISGGSPANSTVQFMTPPSSSYPINPCVIKLFGSTDISGPSNTVQVSIAFNDFTISANPSSSTILAGTSVTSTISVTGLGPGPSTISLTASVAPNGPSVSVNPATLQLPGIGSTAISTLTISTVSGNPGNYVVTVSGTSGSLVHPISLSVAATFDFGVTVSKTSLTINAGYVCEQSSYVTVTSVNGASGNLVLSSAVVPNGPTLELSPSTFFLPSYGSGSSKLYSCAAATASGTFTGTITATIGSVNHSVTISVVVPFPGDPLFDSSQSGLTDLNLPNAWKISAGTHRSVIAIVDSGIQLNHPDLQGNLWTANGFADGTPDGVHGLTLSEPTSTPSTRLATAQLSLAWPPLLLTMGLGLRVWVTSS